MAVEVEILGTGTFAGAASNVGGYTVSEDSTPVVASDTSGAVGEVQFTAVDDSARLGTMLLYNTPVLLKDGDRGQITGVVNDLSGRDGSLTVSGRSRLGTLVADKAATYVNGTFDQAIRYYLSLGGVLDDVAVDASLASIPVIAPGWSGDLWTRIKELCVFAGAEITVIRDNVVVRPVRGRDALEINNIDMGWSVSKSDLAREVEVFYYNSKYLDDALVYPYGGWTPEVTVYSVDAGEVEKINLPVDVTLSEIVPPVAVDFVDRMHSSTSVYSVSGNDGFRIPASMWAAYGGKLTAKIGEDGHSIDIEITGATGVIEKYAPYRIAVSAGPSDYYSSLRIVGTGVGFDRQSIRVPTGADPSQISRDTGVSVDFPFVSTVRQAYDIALDVTAAWSSPERKISVTKADINRPGETSEQYDYATFEDFDALHAGDTFAQFDVDWAGDKFSDFDQYWYEKVQDDFDFQVFGNAAGSRIQFRRNKYRIRQATITESQVRYNAEVDTTFGDFDASATGMTFAQFDTMYSGLTFEEFGLIPLANVLPEYDR